MKRRGAISAAGLWKPLLGPWMAAVILLAYLWAGPLANGFQEPEAARIIFWHVPMAMLGLVWFWTGAYHALRYLYGRDQGNPERDARVLYCSEIGLLCTVLATVTGAVFATVQWGTPWNWDPKQVSITVLILIYMAYFALRASVETAELRARLSAVYAVVGAVATPLLMYVIPQLPQIRQLHPDNVIAGGLDGKWRLIYWMSTLGFLGTSAWIYQLRLRMVELETRRVAAAEAPVRTEATRKRLAEG